MPTKKGPNYDKSNLNKSGYTSHYYKISQNITKKWNNEIKSYYDIKKTKFWLIFEVILDL